METKKIIIDKTKKWQAVIEVFKSAMWLGFEDICNHTEIQGDVDLTVGENEIPTGILNYTILPDDGSFIINFDENISKKIKKELIYCLINLYEINRKHFIKNIEKDIKYNKQLNKEIDNTGYCQSCGKNFEDCEFGTNQDGSDNAEYCSDCFINGNFTKELSIEEMATECMKWYGNYFADKEFAKKFLINERLPQLKRWKIKINKNGKILE